MKVIGKTDKGFILEASNEEVKALLAKVDTRKGSVSASITIGTELTFTIALSNLDLLKDIRLSESGKALAALIVAKQRLEDVIQVVEKAEINLNAVQDKIKVQQA